MTHEEAKKVLDQAREGYSVRADRISIALWVTGDNRMHEAKRSEGVDQEIPPEDWRGRIRQRAILVAASLR